jgi:hypothetical protein
LLDRLKANFEFEPPREFDILVTISRSASGAGKFDYERVDGALARAHVPPSVSAGSPRAPQCRG